MATSSCSGVNNSNSNNIFIKSVIVNESNEITKTNEGVLCEVIAEGKPNVMYVPEEFLLAAGFLKEQTPQKEVIEWGDPDTRLLLDKYDQYIDQIGPFKKFKNKKLMWAKVAKDIEEILCIQRTPSQCENRLKTVLKRKTKICRENRESGATRTDPEYEPEIEKIKAKDDSLEPELLIGVGEMKRNKSIEKPKKEKVNKKDDNEMSKILYKIHEEKERARERRHREKLALIEAILQRKEK